MSIDLSAFFFDVGLGDCTLFISHNETLLIDAGQSTCYSLCAVLERNGIKKIDHLIITHAHEDHIDGMPYIVQNYDIGEVYCNTICFEKSSSFVAIQHELEKQGKKIVVPKSGAEFSFGKCNVKFFSPLEKSKYQSGNDKSLCCSVSCNDKKILMTADAGAGVIGEWLEQGMDLEANVLRIPHHGQSSIPSEFLDRVNPECCIISYGENRFAPLNEKLLYDIKSRNIREYRTDFNGDIHLEIKNDKMEINTVNKQNKKKLLILAANEETKKLVRAAQRKNIYTIVTDNIPNSAAKLIADKSFDVDGKDTDGLIEIIDKEKVDGVLVGVADPLVPSYLEVAQRKGMPCYLSANNIDFFTDKNTFKEKCKQVGLNIIEEYYFGDDLLEVQTDKIKFPCIVKPSRGRGGKGVTLCAEQSQLQENFDKAKSYSDDNMVIIERYMQCEDIVANYYFENGNAHLIAVSDRKTLKKESSISPVTFGNIYPSVLTDLFIEKCHSKFLDLFKELQIKDGVLEMQIFYDGKEFYPYDPACILGGELSGAVFSEALQIDLIDSFIDFAITGRMTALSVPSENGVVPGDKCAASIWILLSPGVIGKIDGLKEVREMENVLDVMQRLYEGDEVSERMFETEKSALARIWISADDKHQLYQTIQTIRNIIRVWNQKGNIMIWEGEI